MLSSGKEPGGELSKRTARSAIAADDLRGEPLEGVLRRACLERPKRLDGERHPVLGLVDGELRHAVLPELGDDARDLFLARASLLRLLIDAGNTGTDALQQVAARLVGRGLTLEEQNRQGLDAGTQVGARELPRRGWVLLQVDDVVGELEGDTDTLAVLGKRRDDRFRVGAGSLAEREAEVSSEPMT